MSKLKLKEFDPRSKIMIMAASSGVCMFSESIMMLVVILLLLLALLSVGGVKLSLAFSRIKGLLLLICSLFVIQSLFMKPDSINEVSLISIGEFNLFYIDGIKLAAVLSLRLLIISVSALILIEGETRDYLLALVQMKMPYEIAFMVMVALHFIPIIREEAINIYCVIQMRGKDIKKMKLPSKLKTYFSLCLPIMAGALRRADEMSIAMEVRGFRAKNGRTNMRKLTLKTRDIILLIVWPLLMVALYFLFQTNFWFN